MQSIPDRIKYKAGQALVRHPEAKHAQPKIHLAHEGSWYSTACGIELDSNHYPAKAYEGTYNLCKRCVAIAEQGKRPEITAGLERYRASVKERAAKHKAEVEQRRQREVELRKREKEDASDLRTLRALLDKVGLDGKRLSNVYTDRNNSYGVGSGCKVAMIDAVELYRLIRMAAKRSEDLLEVFNELIPGAQTSNTDREG